MRLQESAVRRGGRVGALAVSVLAAMMFIGAGSSDRSSRDEVIRVVGDFNGDGRDDIALTGPGQSSGLAVAFSKGDGTFHVTQADVGAFAGRSAHRQAARLVGDFDGDGRDDIALTGVPGWTSVSVAFSDGAGGFVVTDRWAGSLAAWTSHGSSETVTGDFNGDGLTDIAVRPNDDYVAVAYSKGNGSFDVNTRFVGSLDAPRRPSFP